MIKLTENLNQKQHYFQNGKINVFPSLIISEILGIELHKNWNLNNIPVNITSESETIRNSLNLKNYKILLNDNPELKELNKKYKKIFNFLLDKFDNSIDIWYGAFSMFNYYDIDYFLKHHWRERPIDTTIRQEKMEETIGINFQWILSEKTLDLIENQIKNIKTPIPYDKLKESEEKINNKHYTTFINKQYV